MSTQRQRTLHGNPPAPQAFNKYPSRRFPVHHEIQKLQEKLTAFNERIGNWRMKVIEVMRWKC